ncbi:MAG: acyl-CoA dehydrogenase, partial [Deltaproteobacteria bacterium]|nr:acyl-CoA dehydrogenase [Deltaproteobacteria bacterium]
NVLNVGRWKLGAACMGSSKRLIEFCARYAKERKQFKTPIASFQAIREMLANAAIRTYLLESLIYAYAGALDDVCATIDPAEQDRYKYVVKFVKGLNIEASIAKVFGSESIFFTSDDAVQIYGGYGFIRDYPPDQFYRDNRINRIFEGTNEINRLLIPDTLIRRSMKGSIDLMTPIQNVLDGLNKGFSKTNGGGPLAEWIDQLECLKRLALYFSGVVVQKYMEKLKERQLLAMLIADFVIEIYAIQSGLQRALKIAKLKGKEESALAEQMCVVYLCEKTPQLLARARQALFNVAEGNEKEFESYEKALARIIQPKLAPTEALKEKIAARVLEKEGYVY